MTPGSGMRVTFKLFATLGQYLPSQLDGRPRVGNELELEVPEGVTVQAVLDRFPLPAPLVHLVLVNGAFIHPADRAAQRLQAGDALAVWPPIAGG